MLDKCCAAFWSEEILVCRCGGINASSLQLEPPNPTPLFRHMVHLSEVLVLRVASGIRTSLCQGF